MSNKAVLAIASQSEVKLFLHNPAQPKFLLDPIGVEGAKLNSICWGATNNNSKKTFKVHIMINHEQLLF